MATKLNKRELTRAGNSAGRQTSFSIKVISYSGPDCWQYAAEGLPQSRPWIFQIWDSL